MSDKDTTSNNVPLFSNASEEQIKEFNLSKHLVDFLWNEPFYSRILRSLSKVETTSIPTAGVTATDEGELTLFWNRAFLAGLEERHVQGLLKHECLHLVFEHTTDRRKDPHLVWNYSTDLAINSTIPIEELPKGGFVPGVSLPNLQQEQLDKMQPEDIKQYSDLSKLIASLPPNKTSEFYFERLVDEEVIKKEVERAGKENSIIFSFDDHEGWDEISDEIKDQIRGKIKEIVKEGISEAEGRGWGSVPAHLAKQIIKSVSNEIKWNDLLKRFCGFTRRNERSSSIKRLNRKYPNVHPGTKKDYKPMIAVYIDESGSVSNSALGKFYSEIDALSRVADFFVYRFDAEVDDKNGFFWKKGKKINLSRTNVGGTCFQSVTDHAAKNKKKFDGYIIFTDGLAPKPTRSPMRRCWILSERDKLAFEKDRSDILIKIK